MFCSLLSQQLKSSSHQAAVKSCSRIVCTRQKNKWKSNELVQYPNKSTSKHFHYFPLTSSRDGCVGLSLRVLLCGSGFYLLAPWEMVITGLQSSLDDLVTAGLNWSYSFSAETGITLRHCKFKEARRDKVCVFFLPPGSLHKQHHSFVMWA